MIKVDFPGGKIQRIFYHPDATIGASISPKRTPWTHQLNSLENLNRLRMQGHPSAYLEIGTGGGKTLIAAQDALSFIQENKGTRVLWISHRGELLDQAEDTFRELAPETRIFRSIRDNQGNTLNFDDCDVLIISKQTLEKSLRQFSRTTFQYVVIDEAHHAWAEGYLSVLQHLRPQFELGITATPRRFSDRKHIRDLFGPCALKMNLLELVREGILIEKIRFRKVETNIEIEVKLADSGEFNLPHFWSKIKDTTRNELVANIYMELEDNKKGRPALTFCVSVEHAEAMAAIYKSKGVKAEALHGRLSREERKRFISDFENGKLQMLTCVDILNEGYDFPPIEVILMARPTRSKTIWLQQIGRGTRKSPNTGKEDLLIIDFVDNLEAAKRQITFEDIFTAKTPGHQKPSRPPGQEDKREDVYIENIIDMDIGEVFDVMPLSPSELTTRTLAKKIGISPTTIFNAIKDKRIASFIRRFIIHAGNKVPIFDESDINNIRKALKLDTTPLRSGECTLKMLSKILDIKYHTLWKAYKEGRLPIENRLLFTPKGEIPIYLETDASKVREAIRKTEAREGEISGQDLAKTLGVPLRAFLKAIKNKAIDSFALREVIHGRGKIYFFRIVDIDKVREKMISARARRETTKIELEGKLTKIESAKRLGITEVVLSRAIRNGRIRSFVHIVVIRGQKVQTFFENDLDKIKAILEKTCFFEGEIGSEKMAKQLGYEPRWVFDLIRAGKLNDFIKRWIMRENRKNRRKIKVAVFSKAELNSIKTRLENIRSSSPVKGELTPGKLAQKTGVCRSTIAYAINDGRIRGFIVRRIKMGEKEVPLFFESAVPAIKKILSAGMIPLKTGELTTGGLAEKTGYSRSKIDRAVRTGKIRKFRIKTVMHAGRPINIFSENDVPEIIEILSGRRH